MRCSHDARRVTPSCRVVRWRSVLRRDGVGGDVHLRLVLRDLDVLGLAGHGGPSSSRQRGHTVRNRIGCVSPQRRQSQSMGVRSSGVRSRSGVIAATLARGRVAAADQGLLFPLVRPESRGLGWSIERGERAWTPLLTSVPFVPLRRATESRSTSTASSTSPPRPSWPRPSTPSTATSTAVVLDIAGLKFCDGAGLRVLELTRRRLGERFQVRGASPLVLRIAGIVGMTWVAEGGRAPESRYGDQPS